MTRSGWSHHVIVVSFLLPACVAGGESPRAESFKTDVVGLWLMGQSLCDGSESLPIVTAADSGFGNYSFRRGVRTWIQGDHDAAPEDRPNNQFEFVPLLAHANGGLGETIANGLADHLRSTLASRGRPDSREKSPRFLVAYAGQGGRTIEELSLADESTDPRTPAVKRGSGGYYRTSLDDARRAKDQARALNKSFAIGALVWMQGEANGGMSSGIVPSRWKAELPRPQGQHWYRDRLIAYCRQWSDDLCAITGQAVEIPMFTYQTQGPAGEAQLMAADSDPHLYMVGPHYMVPSAINSRRSGAYGAAIHLAADGERWYGEQVAKVVRRVLAEGEDWQPLRPRKATLDPSRANVIVDFVVPRPPLVLDEQFFPREESELPPGFSSLCGFHLRNAAGVPAAITEVKIESPTSVRIRLAAPLPGGSYSLNYGLPFAGKIGAIATVRSGPVVSEQPTTELLIAGSFPDRLKPLLAEGAFYVANSLGGESYAQAPVRHVFEENGFTALRFENRERRNERDFAVGQTLIALRPFAYGNLRDSDPETAIHRFADPAYGSRVGQRYPLWNWLVSFSGFSISEM